MEAFVTTGLVLKETRYKESDRILTILTPELGVISAAAQSSLRLKSKLFRVHTGAGPQHVHCAGSRSEKCLSRHLVQH